MSVAALLSKAFLASFHAASLTRVLLALLLFQLFCHLSYSEANSIGSVPIKPSFLARSRKCPVSRLPFVLNCS